MAGFRGLGFRNGRVCRFHQAAGMLPETCRKSYFCSASGSVALPRSRRVVASSYFSSSQTLSMWLVAGVTIEL